MKAVQFATVTVAACLMLSACDRTNLPLPERPAPGPGVIDPGPGVSHVPTTASVSTTGPGASQVPTTALIPTTTASTPTTGPGVSQVPTTALIPTTTSPPGSTVGARSCQQAEVQAAIDRARAGDQVNVPAGSCTWSGLRVDKAIHLRGAGTGQTVIAVSSSSVTKQAGGIVRVSGFTFERAGGGNATKAFVIDGPWRGAEPVIFERNEFNVSGSGLFVVRVPGGVIFASNSFEGKWDDSFIQLASHTDRQSWAAADTLGTRDTAGKMNIYIEDNTFYGGTNQAIDCDAAARCVYRHNTATYSSFNSHGVSASTQSLRHFEVYDNRFIHLGTTDQIGRQNWAIWIRGGTGVIFDNHFDDIAGSHWGDKSEILLTNRGAEDHRPQGSCAATSYPVPQQLGQSHNGTQSFRDPIYLWGNAGTVGIGAGWNWGNPCGLSFDAFFQWGRDAVADGSPKPGYTPFTHPHPLVSR